MVDGGVVYTFGCNTQGQLGVGDCKPRKGVSKVGGLLAGKFVKFVSCGDQFTVVTTRGSFVILLSSLKSTFLEFR